MQILSIHGLGRGCYRQKVLNSTIEQVTLLIFCIWYLREEIKLMVKIFFFVQKCERYLFCYIFKISERFVLNKSDITYTMISHLKSPSIIQQNQQRTKTYASRWKIRNIESIIQNKRNKITGINWTQFLQRETTNHSGQCCNI